jgi:ABC-2 type transport system permease protein
VALLAGLAYFAFVFGPVLSSGGAGARAGPALPGWVEAVAPLPLLALAAVWWTTGRYHTALAFSPAEVHFLFSAPLGRRQLIRYKLARRQLAVLFTVLLAAINVAVIGRGALTGAELARLLVALWMFVTTLQLHQVGASLVRVAAARQGRAGLRHQWLPLLLFAGAFAAVALALRPVIAGGFQSADPAGMLGRVDSALSSPAPRLALLPFRWALAPLFAPDGAAWLAALPGALLVLWLHYAWVVRTDAGFEEGAAEAGRALAERARARREGRGPAVDSGRVRRRPRPAFRLSARGRPAVAILWKNLTLAKRRLRPSLLALVGGAFAGGYLLLRRLSGDPSEAAVVCATVAFAMAGMMAVAGPLAIRNDLRTDLARLDLLRSYPLSGRDVVAAELAASTVVLTAAHLLLLAVGTAFLLLAFPEMEPPWALPAGAAAALLLLPPVNALLLGAQNAVALLLPGWARLGVERPGGIEQTGTFLLTALATLLFLAVALTPPLTFAAAVMLRAGTAPGPGIALPAALGAWLLLLGEVALLVVLLGKQYDALDPSEAGLLG